jgi:serine/threonine-protein kinase
VIAIDAAPKAVRRGRGYLSVDSRPYGKVYVDGKAVGNTPVIKYALPAGTHRVTIKSSNGKTRRMRVRIRRGKTTARRVTF